LLAGEVISKDGFDELCETIKYCKEDWLDQMKRYDDPDEDNPFFSF